MAWLPWRQVATGVNEAGQFSVNKIQNKHPFTFINPD